MKKKEDDKKINCAVYDCCYCDDKESCCTKKEIQVCNCNEKHQKDATMCDSYKEKK